MQAASSPASATSSGPARPGLRERKKQLTRRAILDAAESLFAQSGYDRVTVAQIADAANVSVKTLFTYFDSKEDLVFGDEDRVRDALVGAVVARPAGTAALDAVREFLKDLARRGDEAASGVESFHAAFGEIPQLHARMLLMYEHYEEALTRVLAEETGVEPTHPAPRVAAAQLVSLLRLITTAEARARIAARPKRQRRAALLAWIDESADLVAGGLANYAVR
jgi:AcrR family transcriptional regulator